MCQPIIRPRIRTVTLEATEAVTGDITAYRFAANSPADFLPGQYAILSEPNGTRRSYSMSNLANPEGVWEFMIKRVPGGCFTGVLSGLGVGDRLALDGPYGMAYLRDEGDRDVVCVAGGSGLSPMVSVARGLAAIDPRGQRHLYFYCGGRHSEDLVDLELLGFGTDRLSATSFVGVVSEEPVGGPHPGGYVHEVLVSRLAPVLPKAEIYFAGPPPMTSALHRALVLGLGIPAGQIHFDRFV